MAICKILIHYPNSENWQVGDVVDITNSKQLIKDGKVELYIPEKEVIFFLRGFGNNNKNKIERW
jgi:hypothetical protein